MRFDKFTTKLQEALAEAQSAALGHDQQYIEPQHLLLALLNQEDGGVSGLLAKAGKGITESPISAASLGKLLDLLAVPADEPGWIAPL